MNPPKLLDNVKFLQKCIIVNVEGKILALLRPPHDLRRPNCWDFPGGNYEKGEEVHAAIKREIMEETSLVAHSTQLIHIASSMGVGISAMTVIAVTHVCSDWEGTVKLSNEHVEYRWVTAEEFLSLETGDDGGFLKDSVRIYLALPH